MAKKKLEKQNKKTTKKSSFFKKYFLLNSRRILLVVLAWFVSVILHNFIYGVVKYFYPAWQGDEVSFFLIAVILIPLYFLTALIYTIVTIVKNKKYSRGFLIGILISLAAGIITGYVLYQLSKVS